MTNRLAWTSAVTPVLLAGILVLLAYGLFLHERTFEYRTRFIGDQDQDSPEKLEQVLDALGAEGWELVSFKTENWDNDWNPTTARVALRRRRR